MKFAVESKLRHNCTRYILLAYEAWYLEKDKPMFGVWPTTVSGSIDRNRDVG